MEMINEDNSYYMEMSGDENPAMMFFNDSNYSTSIQEYQTECLPHNVEELQEEEQPVCKLNNVDTEASIKPEIKQLLLTKISEEISSNTLNDMTYEAEEQISTLKDKTEGLENKIQELEKEVEADQDRLVQTDEILMKTDEMISLLKENIEKLMARYRESRINELAETSTQQLEKLSLLKISYQTQIDKQKDFKNKEADGMERNTILRTELAQKDEILKILRKKQDEFKKITSYDEEIEKNLAKKRDMEVKLKSIANKRAILENEFRNQKDAFNRLSLRRINSDKLTELNERKIMIQNQLDTASHELDEAKTRLTESENQILQKEIELNELKCKLETVKQDRQESFDTYQHDYTNTCHQVKTLSTNILTCNTTNDHLLMEVNSLQTKYMQKCDEKLTTINRYFEKQNDMQKVQIDLLKKQTENEMERSKFEELQKQYEKSVEVLKLLENDTAQQRQNGCDELRQLKLKLEAAEADYNNFCFEMKKKKEYLLTNSKFLEEKSENLKHERMEVAESVKNLEEENVNFKVLIEKKVKQLDERKSTLNTLKKAQSEIPLKSGLKSPNNDSISKTVKFNEKLSFKSPSSSEVSNLPVSSASQLETSVHEWLGDEQEKTDEEF